MVAPFYGKKSNQLAELALADPTGLAVTLPLVITRLVLELVDDDLRALGVRDDLTRDRHLSKGVGLGGDRWAIDEENRRQGDCGTRIAFQLLDLDDVTLGDLVLLAAGLDDRVHRGRAFLPVVEPVLPGVGGLLLMPVVRDKLLCVAARAPRRPPPCAPLGHPEVFRWFGVGGVPDNHPSDKPEAIDSHAPDSRSAGPTNQGTAKPAAQQR